jgi:hypothetical protein
VVSLFRIRCGSSWRRGRAANRLRPT